MQEIKLTLPEKFILSRRREKISRNTYAKKHKLSVYRISKIEKGNSRNNKIDFLIKPKRHEVAYILRKRAKLKINELAKILQVSKQTILNREAGRRDPIQNIAALVKILNGRINDW